MRPLPLTIGILMDQNENQNSPRTRDYVAVAVVVGSAMFGAYQIGMLTAEWVGEGYRSLKAKKKSQTEN